MFHVRDDFAAGAPISQVPASWFNKVGAFLNNLIGGKGVKFNPTETGPQTIELAPDFILSKETGTLEDHTDTETDDDNDGDNWHWTAGGENGLVVDVYCKIEEEDGWHYPQRCRMTISKDGLILSVAKLNGRREIEA